jgi:hypothetical protein
MKKKSEGDQPGNAWMYVHVTDFQFLVKNKKKTTIKR